MAEASIRVLFEHAKAMQDILESVYLITNVYHHKNSDFSDFRIENESSYLECHEKCKDIPYSFFSDPVPNTDCNNEFEVHYRIDENGEGFFKSFETVSRGMVSIKGVRDAMRKGELALEEYLSTEDESASVMSFDDQKKILRMAQAHS